MLAKEVDHRVCGPPPETIAVDIRILTHNEEFAVIHPQKIQPGLQTSRKIDHHIDIKPESKPPASRLYRMSLNEDEELQTLL